MLESKQFYHTYDVASTSYVYGRLGDNTGNAVQGKGAATNSGSSTDVVAVSGTPFDPMAAGDVIILRRGDTQHIRKVATKTDGATLVVDSAVDLSAGSWAFDFYPFRVGSAITNGWHHCQAYEEITLLIKLGTVQAGGVSISVECPQPSIGATTAAAEQLWTQDYAAGSAYDEPLVIGERVQALRVGVKGTTAATGTDSITISMVGKIKTRG